MKISRYKIFSLFFVLGILINSQLFAMVPVQSLVLGNFSENYSEKENDPLFYISNNRSDIKESDLKVFQKFLGEYRGFYEEGKNLDRQCSTQNKIEYSTELEKIQVERSILATLQYIILDLTTRAIPQYAKFFEFSRDEYANLVESMIGSFCSENLSVISKKELKNNLFLKYDKENLFQLPSITNNQFFPNTLKKGISEKTLRENEFKYSVKIFQNACSWSGNPRKAGLLIPFLHDSNLMAFVIRQMSHKSIVWNDVKKSLYFKDDAETASVWCTGYICRKNAKDKFDEKVFHSIGGSNIYEDFKRLYCDDLKLFYFVPKGSDPKIQKIMNSITLDEENFLNSQLIALITGVPDFLLASNKFNNGEEIIRSSIDQLMEDWSKHSLSQFSDDLLFEEPLTLELIQREQYFNRYSPSIKILLDVNLGEFDRVDQTIGKIKVGFEINILNSYLRYYRQAKLDLDPDDIVEKNRLLSQLKLQITKDVMMAKEKFVIPPWKGDLEGILANEISEQLILKNAQALQISGTGMQKIIVEISYAPFALKYINHQFDMLKGSHEKDIGKK